MLIGAEMFALADGTVILGRRIQPRRRRRGGGSLRGAASGVGFEGGNSFAEGVLRELRYAVRPDFFHHPAAVGFDGLGADADGGGDLLGACAVGDLAEDLFFAAGEGEGTGGGRGFVLEHVTADDGFGDVRAEV